MSISRTILSNNDAARSEAELAAGYRAMADDTGREAEALEWAETLIKDSAES